MSQNIIHLKIDKILPTNDAVFTVNGYPLNKVPENIRKLVAHSLKIFTKYAEPVCIYSKITKTDFGDVISGEGNNQDPIPLQTIYPRADELFLFVLTLGEPVSEKIRELFNNNDFAEAHMLDCLASLATDIAANSLIFTSSKKLIKDLVTLTYSPGYCGWHISGQKKLFEYLHPEKIGITLNSSFLMTPVKSVSGVLISGKKEIHRINNNFPFCAECRTKNCSERV
jgi:cobalamin-dependent methionine synthase-like protein